MLRKYQHTHAKYAHYTYVYKSSLQNILILSTHTKGFKADNIVFLFNNIKLFVYGSHPVQNQVCTAVLCEIHWGILEIEISN